MADRTYTLVELNRCVADAIDTLLPGEYWVEAELAELHTRNHCYMELVEHGLDSRTPVARARAVCWASRWSTLSQRFERQAGQPLQAGMRVLMRVRATFHEAYGFAYQVTDIDPAYSLGDIARRRMEIIRQLREEGVLDLQRDLRLPLFAQRVAIVSSDTAAGYGDFCRQLADNSYGLAFTTELFAATMQGEQVEPSVVAALDRIYQRIDDFDVVVIIRGGGATMDMSGFDTLRLAENVANFPLPIITGIGHDRDECILDMVAYRRVKTPTAAAAFLIDHLAEVYRRVTTANERIARLAGKQIDYERMRLAQIGTRLSSHLRQRIGREQMRLAQIADRLPSLLALAVERRTVRLSALEQALAMAAARRLQAERHRLDLLRQRAQAQDPIHILRRGYSVTLHRGRVVRSARDVAEGDVVETRLEQGTIKSRITQ